MLPPGLSLSSAGTISGTPTQAGVSSFTVQAQDADGQTFTQQFSLTVAGAPIGTAGIQSALSSLVVPLGQSVTLTYTITGAVSAFLGGNMMPGPNIPLIADGQQHAIQYTPVVSGPFPITAIDAAGGVVVQPEVVVVQQPNLPALDPNAPPSKTTVQSGALDDPATWGGTLPGRDDTCVIQVGHALTYSGKGFWTGKLVVYGSLTVTGGVPIISDLWVPVGGTLTLDGTTVAGKSLVLMMNRPQHANDATDFWRAVYIQGTLIVKGLPKTAGAVRLAAAPKAGDTMLSLATPVTGWNVGDKVWLPDSRQIDPRTTGFAHHGEVVIVRGVSADGKTVYLLNPCQYAHPGSMNANGSTEYMPHCANLIRLAGFVTSDPTTSTTRAHFQATGSATVDIQYGVFHGLGRTLMPPAATPDQRFNLHLWNLVGPQGGLPGAPQYQFRVLGSVLLDPYPVVPAPQVKWGLCLTNSHYGLIDSNVAFNWGGAGFVFANTGNETANVFSNNLATRINGSGQRQEHGTQGDGFWGCGPASVLTNNVTAHIQDSISASQSFESYGFQLNMSQQVQRPFPNYQGADTTQTGQYTMKLPMSIPLAGWSGNEMYCGPSGWTHWWIGMQDPTTPVPNMPPSLIAGQVVWSNWKYGCFAYQSNNLTIDRLVVRGDPSVPSASSHGLLFSDYSSQNLTVSNFDIRGHGVGIYPCANPQQGTQTFTTGTIQCVTDVRVEGQWTSGSDARLIGQRKVVLDDITHIALPGQSHTAIQMLYNPVAVHNLINLDQTYVTNFNGTAGDNFRCYFTQQASSFVIPASTITGGVPKVMGCAGMTPVASLTNAQSQAQYGVCIADEIAPANATTRTGIVGVVA